MQYGPIPLDKLQNQKFRTLPVGTFSLSSVGLCFTVKNGEAIIHLLMQGDSAFSEVPRSFSAHEVAVLPPGELSVTIGAISRLDGAGDWPHGWLAVTTGHQIALAIILTGLGGRTEHLLVDLQTGISTEAPDNWQHLVWVREWTLLKVDGADARYQLTQFKAPARS